MVRAPGTGMVAAMAPWFKPNAITAPGVGGAPFTGAVGTAAKPRTLSLPASILSVGPGKMSAGAVVVVLLSCQTVSLSLSITVMELLSGLKTRVNSPLGESTINPGPEGRLT